MDQIDRGEIQLDDKDGSIRQNLRAGLERWLNAEPTEHLRYDKHASEGHGTGNSRNGSYAKTVSTAGGDIDIAIPRDRTGTFTATLVPKGRVVLVAG